MSHDLPVPSRSTEAPPANRRGKRWMIRVTYESGYDAYLRRGCRPESIRRTGGYKLGLGAIVQFRSKRDAEVNLDFVTQGLDGGTTAMVVPYDKSEE